jgi:hypothetical protein
MKLVGANDLIWKYNKLLPQVLDSGADPHRARHQISRYVARRAKDAAMSLALRALNAPVVAKIRGETSPLEARPCVSTRKVA